MSKLQGPFPSYRHYVDIKKIFLTKSISIVNHITISNGMQHKYDNKFSTIDEGTMWKLKTSSQPSKYK